MAAPLGPLSDPGAEKSLLEINQDLQSQLEKSKQDFRDLKEKFLISEATAYSLANQLQKYIIDSWCRHRNAWSSQDCLCAVSDPASQ
uniref:Neuroblastoma breakpoint family member 5 n=1 Tax=Ursus americanus TaxID=9643 RepID=A0A452QCH2_URSAM